MNGCCAISAPGMWGKRPQMIALEIGFSFLAGLAIGYVIATVVESYVHQQVGHASRQTVERWKQRSGVYEFLERINYAHNVVHHQRTFRGDYVTQFESGDQRNRLDQELAALGAEGRRIIRSNYGLRLQDLGALVFFVPLLPVLPWIGSRSVIWAALGATMAMALPPILSQFIHPYLHLPYEQAVRQGPALTSWLLRRRYFRLIAQHHFVHHRHPRTNFNLLLGGDWLRGRHRRADAQQRAEMRRLGLRID